MRIEDWRAREEENVIRYSLFGIRNSVSKGDKEQEEEKSAKRARGGGRNNEEQWRGARSKGKGKAEDMMNRKNNAKKRPFLAIFGLN